MSIIVHQLIKSFGPQAVLREVSFEARPGRVTGFLGPNGAGKTTTMRILTGSLTADSGEIRILGQPLDPGDPGIRREVGYLPEHNPLYLDMYVLETLQFTAKLYGVLDPARRIAEVIEQTGLGPEQHKQLGKLSRGYRQRVGIAQAILHNPSVLILDEPTTGLDPNQLIDIRQLIRELGQSRTVLLSTHIMQEVEAVCDDVVIIHQGRIVAQSAMDSLRETFAVADIEELFVSLTKSSA